MLEKCSQANSTHVNDELYAVPVAGEVEIEEDSKLHWSHTCTQNQLLLLLLPLQICLHYKEADDANHTGVDAIAVITQLSIELGEELIDLSNYEDRQSDADVML